MMSDFRTLRDECSVQGPRPAVGEYLVCWVPTPLLYLRICGDALVALDVGEGAVELRHVCDEWFARDRLQNDDEPHEALLEFVTRILAACGVHVPDRRIEVVDERDMLVPSRTTVTWTRWEKGRRAKESDNWPVDYTRKEGESK